MEFLFVYPWLLLLAAAFDHNGRLNLALNQSTKQSGRRAFDYGGYLHEGNSSFAVDGITATDPENMTCSQSERFPASWWMVDLGQSYLITDVAVLTRVSWNVLNNFKIEMSLYWNEVNQTLHSPVLCYAQAEGLAKGERTALSCYSRTMGRYVRVTKTKPEPRSISICEFEVYGTTTERLFNLSTRKGKRSLNRCLETVRARSATSCLPHCQRHLDCTSFNMADGEDECELIADPIDDIDGNENEESGWTRFLVY